MAHSYKDNIKWLSGRLWDASLRIPYWSHHQYSKATIYVSNNKYTLRRIKKLRKGNKNIDIWLDWYSRCPKWWNKLHHIKPQRRQAKHYIYLYLNNKPSNHINPHQQYSAPTVYYY